MLTNEEFKQELLGYMKRAQLTQSQVAELIGRSKSTICDWVKKGIRPDNLRMKTVRQYPEIFLQYKNGEGSAKTEPEPVVLAEEKSLEKSAVSQDISQIQLLLKTELARTFLASLVGILVWFLKASESDRDTFRKELGESWSDLLNLTRALTGSMAFEVIKREGGLDKWLQRPTA